MDQSVIGSILPLIVLFAIFYFLIIRPQQQQQKKHKAMIDALDKGDKVVTNGGLRVEIVKVEEEFFKVQLEENNYAKLEKEFVAKKIENESNAKSGKEFLAKKDK